MNKPNRSKYYDSNHNSSLLNLPVMRAAYSDRTAWLMARCSELAYVEFEAGQEQQLRDSLKELGLEFVRGFSRDATCACLARNRSEERRVGKSVDLGGRRISKKNTRKMESDV